MPYPGATPAPSAQPSAQPTAQPSARTTPAPSAAPTPLPTACGHYTFAMSDSYGDGWHGTVLRVGNRLNLTIELAEDESYGG